MSVYYVHAPELGLLKIGYATDVATRFSSIQTHSPTRLVLLATEDGGGEVEAERHSRFAALRARGEWFHFEGDLADFVASLQPYEKARSRRALSGPLGKWLIENDHTLESFGKLIGRTKGNVSEMMNGRCSATGALMIEKATGGQVNASDLSPIIAQARRSA